MWSNEMTILPRSCRFFLSFLAVLVGCAVALPAAAADVWPSKPVKLIVPFPPGGGNDVFARELGQALQNRFGQPFVVENRGGAAGNIGIAAAASSPADGYTLLVVSNTLVTNPALSANTPYDIYKDFVPISLAANLPVALVTGPHVQQKTLKDLIAYAKEHPGLVTYGTAGMGAPHHLTTEYFASRAGVKLLHVPFKGQGQIVPELLAGRVDMAFLAIASVMQFLPEGKLHGIAAAGKERTPILPNLPTLAEVGLPGVSVDWWLGVLAPAGTPNEIVQKLSAEILALCQQPQFRERLAKQGIDAIGSSPEQFASVLKEEVPRWMEVVKNAGIKTE
jgi:tripartite-type tricarboxylate transporter receptor subunit TctC